MRRFVHPAAAAVPALLACATFSFLPAQFLIDVGGPGTVGCQSGSPPLLSNGDLAKGTITYQYDPATARLTLVVANTSPVLVGTPTALITDVFLNLPAGVTGTTLLSQSAGSGTPAYAVVSSAVGTGCLGQFDLQLDNGNGIEGGIAVDDPNVVLPQPSAVTGPATFVLGLTGSNLGSLDTQDFVTAASSGGTWNVVAGFRFQGSQGAGSGTIGSAPLNCVQAASVVDLGAGCGVPTLPQLLLTPPVVGQPATLCVLSDHPNAHTWVLMSVGSPANPFLHPSGCVIYVDLAPSNFFFLFESYTDANGDFCVTFPVPPAPGFQVTLQGRVWAAGGPLAGDHLTNGLHVTLGCF